MVTEKTSIRKWYIETYPTDDLGQNLNDVTFYELFECMDRFKSVYDFLGDIDSIIRERIFEQLAKIMKCDYDYIYNQWLLCKE